MGTLFENNDRFENASLMLEVCRGVFEKHGLRDGAKMLRGMEATSVDAVRACLAALEAVQVVNEETETAKSEAARALTAVLPHQPATV
jgi:ribosomal protein S5